MLGRLGQPPVLGELLMGVLLGNLSLFGITALEPLRDSSMLRVVAEIGAILLLFEVGVESDLFQLLAVGWSSLVVATLGVIAPMILGYIVSSYLLPDASWLTHLFVGGTLTATSVGITARVLKDLGKANTKEARIILGAAVADDVIGLVVLAVVSGLVTAATASSGANGGVSLGAVLWIVLKASVFLILAVIVGRFWSQRIFVHAAKLQVPGVLLGLCLCFCFIVSAISGFVGLAPIVGAFAAGIVLEEVHYHPFRERGERKVEELLFPITTLIVPVFFVMMGFRVDLKSFASLPVLGFAGVDYPGRDCRQTDLRPRRAGARPRPLGYRRRHDSPRRSRLNLCGHGRHADAGRKTNPIADDFFRAGADDYAHDLHYAALVKSGF